jgi:hypothetical protein
MKPKLAAAASSMRVIGAVFCTFDPTQNKELPLLYAVGAPSLCHCLCGGGLKKTSPLTFQMSDFETQKILMKNKKVYLWSALKKCDRILFSALPICEWTILGEVWE